MRSIVTKKYDGPSSTRTEIYACHIACCPLVCHVGYAPRALLGLEKMEQADRRTDARLLHYALR